MNYLERVNDSGKPVLIAPECDLYLERYTNCAHPGLWITVRRPGEYPDACLELIRKVPHDVTGCYYDFAMWMAREVMPDVRKHKEYVKKLHYPYPLGRTFWVVEKENSNIPVVVAINPNGYEVCPVPYWVTDDDRLERLKEELQEYYLPKHGYDEDDLLVCIPPLPWDEVIGLRSTMREKMTELNMIITENPSNLVAKSELDWWWKVFCRTEEMLGEDIYILWFSEFLQMKNLLLLYKRSEADVRILKAQDAFRSVWRKMQCL